MTKDDSIGNALASLSGLLKEKEKELEEREGKLRKEEEKFHRERFAAYGDTKPSDVLNLNISGTKTAVLRRTLTSVPGSMLASRFSGRWDDSLEKDKDGCFFIDQEFSLFHPMLSYLRNRSNGTETYVLESPEFYRPNGQIDKKETKNFYRMLEYYGMTHSIYPTNLIVRFGSTNAMEMISPWKVKASEWMTFGIKSTGHSRCIKSYEIRLGSTQRAQVGWECHEADFSAGNSSGAGDVEYTSAIDLSRSLYLIDGQSTSIRRLECKEGTTVRLEDYGKRWYVDGELVASSESETTREDGVVLSHDATHWGINEGWQYMTPLISINGEVEITSLEFKS